MAIPVSTRKRSANLPPSDSESQKAQGIDPPALRPAHAVQFYESDKFLVEAAE